MDNFCDVDDDGQGAKVEDVMLIRDLETEALKDRMDTFTDKQ